MEKTNKEAGNFMPEADGGEMPEEHATKLDTNRYEFRGHTILLQDYGSNTFAIVDHGQLTEVSGGLWESEKEAILSAEDEINKMEVTV